MMRIKVHQRTLIHTTLELLLEIGRLSNQEDDLFRILLFGNPHIPHKKAKKDNNPPNLPKSYHSITEEIPSINQINGTE